MRLMSLACAIVSLLTSTTLANIPDQPWPADLQAPRSLSYDDIDLASHAMTGKLFHEYLGEIDTLRHWFHSEEETRTWLAENVGLFRLSDHHAKIALYTAYAEETSFRERPGETGLEIGTFGGMNVAHRLVAEMLEQMLADVIISPEGEFTGMARLYVDTGAEPNLTLIEVDFDAATIMPDLQVTGPMGQGIPITTEDIARFIRMFRMLAQTDPNGISIFVRLPDIATIRHEVMHALYAAEAAYREQIRDYARELNAIERELAVLFTAIHYDVFDPDILVRNPDIVLDEALNAYRLEGMFDPHSGRSRFSIGDFLRAHPLDLSLSAWTSIDDLPIADDSRALLARMYDASQADHETGFSEAEFMEQWRERIFDNLYCLRFLRQLLIEQQPEFHARLMSARRLLVDERVLVEVCANRRPGKATHPESWPIAYERA